VVWLVEVHGGVRGRSAGSHEVHSGQAKEWRHGLQHRGGVPPLFNYVM